MAARVAYNIGAPVWYGVSEKEVVFKSECPSAPKRLPFCTANGDLSATVTEYND